MMRTLIAVGIAVGVVATAFTQPPASSPATENAGLEVEAAVVAELIHRLETSEPAEWGALEHELLRRRESATLRAALIELLDRPRLAPVVRQRAEWVVRQGERELPDRGYAAKHPDVAAWLLSSVVSYRSQGVEALWRDGAVAWLIERALDVGETHELRTQAIWSLAEVPVSSRVVSVLRAVGQTATRDVAMAAFFALQQLARRHEQFAALSRRFGMPWAMSDAGVRQAAVEALGHWRQAREPWRRMAAWSVTALNRQALSVADVERHLSAEVEPDAEVRALVARLLPGCLNLPREADPVARRQWAMKRLLQSAHDAGAVRDAVQSVIAELGDDEWRAALVFSELPEEVIITLAPEFWDAAVRVRVDAVRRLSRHSNFAMMRHARRALLRGWQWRDELATWPLPDVRLEFGCSLRDVWVRLSRAVRVDLMPASAHPYLNRQTLRGVIRGSQPLYDVLATLGESLDLRFDSRHDAIDVFPAIGSDLGDRLIPRRDVGAVIAAKLRQRPPHIAPAKTLRELVEQVAAVVDAPVMLGSAVGVDADTRLEPLDASIPLENGVRRLLAPLGLDLVVRGFCVWFATPDEIRGWEKLDRYLAAPDPARLAELATLKGLNTRPVIAELLRLTPKAALAESESTRPWATVALDELAATRSDIRAALLVRQLPALTLDMRIMRTLLLALQNRSPLITAAARAALSHVPDVELWRHAAIHLASLNQPAALMLTEVLARSATIDRLRILLRQWMAYRPLGVGERPAGDVLEGMLDAAWRRDGGVPWRTVVPLVVRLAAVADVTVPLEQMPLGTPLVGEARYGSPERLASILAAISGQRIVAGAVARRWYPHNRYPPLSRQIVFDGTEFRSALRTGLQRTVTQLEGGPMIFEPRYFPGATLGGEQFPAEVVIGVPQSRNEAALLRLLLELLADSVENRMILRSLDQFAERDPHGAIARLAEAAWDLTDATGVSTALESASKPLPEVLRPLQSTADAVSAADRVWWLLTAPALRRIEATDYVAVSEPVARLGLRIRWLAKLSPPAAYDQFIDRAANETWLTPR